MGDIFGNQFSEWTEIRSEVTMLSTLSHLGCKTSLIKGLRLADLQVSHG